MAYKTIYTEVEVDVELAEFDTNDLLEELAERGALPVEGDYDSKALVEQMYFLRRQGQDYDHLLDSLFYAVLGKIV